MLIEAKCTHKDQNQHAANETATATMKKPSTNNQKKRQHQRHDAKDTRTQTKRFFTDNVTDIALIILSTLLKTTKPVFFVDR